MRLKNMYVLVQDTDRAINFYTNTLNFNIYRKQDRYSILQLGDVWFGLLNESFMDEVKRGNNCIPVFEVEDIEAEFKRLKAKGVNLETELVELPDVRFFQFYDTEGNILEMYQEK